MPAYQLRLRRLDGRVVPVTGEGDAGLTEASTVEALLSAVDKAAPQVPGDAKLLYGLPQPRDLRQQPRHAKLADVGLGARDTLVASWAPAPGGAAAPAAAVGGGGREAPGAAASAGARNGSAAGAAGAADAADAPSRRLRIRGRVDAEDEDGEERGDAVPLQDDYDDDDDDDDDDYADYEARAPPRRSAAARRQRTATAGRAGAKRPAAARPRFPKGPGHRLGSAADVVAPVPAATATAASSASQDAPSASQHAPARAPRGPKMHSTEELGAALAQAHERDGDRDPVRAFFRRVTKEMLGKQYEITRANARVAAALGGKYELTLAPAEAAQGGETTSQQQQSPPPQQQQQQQRLSVRFLCGPRSYETEVVDLISEPVLKAVLREVMSAPVVSGGASPDPDPAPGVPAPGPGAPAPVEASPENSPRERLRARYMAQLSPRFFWSLVYAAGHGDVELALRQMLPDVNWDFLNTRARRISERAAQARQAEALAASRKRPRVRAGGAAASSSSSAPGPATNGAAGGSPSAASAPPASAEDVQGRGDDGDGDGDDDEDDGEDGVDEDGEGAADDDDDDEEEEEEDEDDADQAEPSDELREVVRLRRDRRALRAKGITSLLALATMQDDEKGHLASAVEDARAELAKVWFQRRVLGEDNAALAPKLAGIEVLLVGDVHALRVPGRSEFASREAGVELDVVMELRRRADDLVAEFPWLKQLRTRG